MDVTAAELNLVWVGLYSWAACVTLYAEASMLTGMAGGIVFTMVD